MPAAEIVWPPTLSEIVMPKLGTDKKRGTSEPPEGTVGDPSPPQPNNDADTTTRTASCFGFVDLDRPSSQTFTPNQIAVTA